MPAAASRMPEMVESPGKIQAENLTVLPSGALGYLVGLRVKLYTQRNKTTEYRIHPARSKYGILETVEITLHVRPWVYEWMFNICARACLLALPCSAIRISHPFCRCRIHHMGHRRCAEVPRRKY